MTLHLVKLCVGAGSIEDLDAWQKGRFAEQRKAGERPRLFHTTFQTPKRQAELLDGGSLYWVIKGVIQVRQRLVGFEEGTKADGSRCCLMLLDAAFVAVRPVPRRAFQGWRYLAPPMRPPIWGGREGPRGNARQDAPRARRARALVARSVETLRGIFHSLSRARQDARGRLSAKAQREAIDPCPTRSSTIRPGRSS